MFSPSTLEFLSILLFNAAPPIAIVLIAVLRVRTANKSIGTWMAAGGALLIVDSLLVRIVHRVAVVSRYSDVDRSILIGGTSLVATVVEVCGWLLVLWSIVRLANLAIVNVRPTSGSIGPNRSDNA